MKIRPALIETVALAVFVVIGMVFRLSHLDREAVEHFDEGIYASMIWHDGAFQQPYPARELYSPPLLPALIDSVHILPGLGRYAPFLPSAIFGLLTIPALWWLARSWFGKAAGIFIAAIVAMSDFHILYSRMAMTDVSCLLWIVGSVYLGTLAIQKRSFSIAAMSGLCCGLAWWTKYTGWLPLAILISGIVLWWTWTGRKQIGAIRTLALLLVIAFTAGLTFAPWWWHLQSLGGYSAVSANHVGYMAGFSSWRDNLATQLTYQFWLDGSSGTISLGLGMAAAGLYRWLAADCSTWNTLTKTAVRLESSAESKGTNASRRLLVRFLVAAAALSVIAFRIWTPLMLSCIALGGFGGMFLWPVLRRLWIRSSSGDVSPTSDGSLPLRSTDLETSATIDPALGLCTTLTWFLGLLLTTPLYHPYSRLFFPLLASVWLAAAGGISWWLESNVSVARRMVASGEKAAPKTWGQRLVTMMLAAAVLSSFAEFDENNDLVMVNGASVLHSALGRDRTSIVEGSTKLADSCVFAARGTLRLPAGSNIPIGETIRPEAVEPPTIVVDQTPAITVTDRQKERLVVYVYGEPALCFHLAAAGISVVPVSHLNLSDTDGSEPDVPTFLIIGPNAKRTPGFWEQWMQRINAFDFVQDVDYSPSEVTLLDLFSPKWLSQHDEAMLQKFELHRVK